MSTPLPLSTMALRYRRGTPGCCTIPGTSSRMLAHLDALCDRHLPLYVNDAYFWNIPFDMVTPNELASEWEYLGQNRFRSATMDTVITSKWADCRTLIVSNVYTFAR